ncbi:c-type cytochrome [Pseudoflavitalea sp. X16]|uniref:cbb3-type cytochrome c oxidase N-terminal domain-containing protein n=1 Tax=Paraflavitalea devenefica TaxID=2716334 RepID=UPI0014242DDA|nr:cbb3-type cytochrome c oxidase N-terminal domain-containing protein [Paraflavitalea devenefica]NII27803.1 c-type cytochrome [Paraflavitalea devenefica]
MSLYKKICLLAITVSCHTFLFAQAPAPAAIEDPFVVTMIIIMILLALIIGLLAWVVLGSAQVYLEKSKQEEATAEKKSNPVTAAATVLAALLGSLAVQAEETGAGVVVKAHNISDTAFYTMAGVIFLELIVIGALLYNLRVLLEIRKKKKAVLAGAPVKPALNWWARLNKFRPVEQESSLDLGHEYDGIRELDNRLPPWWLYGFYLTIIFAGIYLWRYHVSHTAPSSGEEYQLAVKAAEVKRAEFLKKAANNVDENTVEYLPASDDLAAGQKIYATTCFPCHGKQGEGGVGPNLTDDYWLHGGSVKDIFKTIKYGVPEKGMKSWKDDYSPVQLAQLTSYIRSIKGTNPPNAKAAQGTIYQEEGAKAGDSTKVAASGK